MIKWHLYTINFYLFFKCRFFRKNTDLTKKSRIQPKNRTFNQIIDIQHWIRLTIDKSWIKNKATWPIIQGQLHWCQTEKDMPAFLLCLQSHFAQKIIGWWEPNHKIEKTARWDVSVMDKNDFSGSIRAFFCHLMLLRVCGLRARHIHAALGWRLVEGEPLP